MGRSGNQLRKWKIISILLLGIFIFSLLGNGVGSGLRAELVEGDWDTSTLEPTFYGVVNGQALASALAFQDTSGHWAQNSIVRIAAQGIMRGYGGGWFQPNQAISRQEVIAAVVQALALDLNSGNNGGRNRNQVVDADAWATAYVQAAAGAEILVSDELGAKDWKQPAARQEIAAWLAQALDLDAAVGGGKATLLSYVDANQVDPTLVPLVEAVIQQGLMTGMSANYLDPQGALTRAQLAVILDRASSWLYPKRGISEYRGTIKAQGSRQAFDQGSPVFQIQYRVEGADPLVTRLLFQEPTAGASEGLNREALVYQPQTNRLGTSSLLNHGQTINYLVDGQKQVFYIEVAGDAESTAEGYIREIDVASGLLHFEDEAGNSSRLTLSPQVVVSVNNRPAAIGDLLVGQEIVASLIDGKVQSIRAQLPQVNPGYLPSDRQVHSGRVQSVEKRSGTNSEFEHVLRIQEQGEFVDYILTANTYYTKNNQGARLEQISPGDMVQLHLEEDLSPEILRSGQATPDERRVARLIVESNPAQNIHLIRGQIDSVSPIQSQLVLQESSKYSQGSWQNVSGFQRLEMGSEAVTYADGRKVNLSELQRSEYRGREIYAAVAEGYGSPRVVQMVVNSGYSNDFTDAVYGINYGLQRLSLYNRAVYWNEGTLVVRDGRLLDPTSLQNGQSLYVIGNPVELSTEWSYRANVIVVEDGGGSSSAYHRFLRGKIENMGRTSLELWDVYDWDGPTRAERWWDEELRLNEGTQVLDSIDNSKPGIYLSLDALRDRHLEADDEDREIRVYAIIGDGGQTIALNVRAEGEGREMGADDDEEINDWVNQGTISKIDPLTGLVTISNLKNWDTVNENWKLNPQSRILNFNRTSIVIQDRPAKLHNLKVGQQVYWLEDLDGPVLATVEN